MHVKLVNLKNVSGLYQHQFPGGGVVLRSYKMISLGKLGEEYMRSLCIIFFHCMCINNYLKTKNFIKDDLKEVENFLSPCMHAIFNSILTRKSGLARHRHLYPK